MFLTFVVLMAALAGASIFWLGSRIVGTPRTGHWFGPGGVIVFVLIVIVLVARGARRAARPIGDVMDAAERVSAGDYAARVVPGGPREVRQLGRSFNAMAERLEATERARRQLFADVAHELRTPMSVVQAYVEGVLDGLYPADAAHLGPVLEETKVMARLLDDLSTLAMAESGALRLHLEPTDPFELVEEIVAAHRPEARGDGVDLTTTSPATGAPAVVQLDPVRIREVLSNLVANALRYTPPGGRITVGVAAGTSGVSGASEVAFSVSDTGPGIPADRLATVFDRFSKSPDSRGAGLGLSIAKGLVEAHGGRISVGSTASGTVFTFVLPVGGDADHAAQVR
jgi:two-component system, OmpR family, sensor histidine kinase BaeS